MLCRHDFPSPVEKKAAPAEKAINSNTENTARMIPSANPSRSGTPVKAKLAIMMIGGVKVMVIVAMYWNAYAAWSGDRTRPVYRCATGKGVRMA